MNYRLLCRLLGIVALLIGGMMVFSLLWAWPALGQRWSDKLQIAGLPQFEAAGFLGLLASVLVSLLVAAGLLYLGRGARGVLYRKEALAVVGLSWILATALGALPFLFAGVGRSCPVRLSEPEDPVLVYEFGHWIFRHWRTKPPLDGDQFRVLRALSDAGSRGLPEAELSSQSGVERPLDLLRQLAAEDRDWAAAVRFPGAPGPPDRRQHVRLLWIRMGLSDALFESQSGFSTTGATVIADLEDPYLVPHSILFWRSSTHFLGGLGIIVFFVTILGHGSAGKALMRAEMPGPTKEGSTARMQHTAWLFAVIYCALNLVLAAILMVLGLSPFDAICHAFGTMATGGFSTYNASLGHFDSSAIEYVVTFFMILAGSNFTLLYLFLARQPGKLLNDPEWQTYIGIIAVVTLLVIAFGIASQDFPGESLVDRLANGLRYGLFQVVSIITTTGYGTHDFDRWNSFGRGVLFLLMFVGGCAGSTGGGLKVIRHVLFVKILGLEIEQSFHPSVVRPLRLGGKPAEDSLRRTILVYFGLITIIFVGSWMFMVTVEPDRTWGHMEEHKLIDSASAIAATLNNIGPGLGTVGSTQNYSHFSPISKFLFVWLMMIGRLEIFAILVLFSPRFWRVR